jgi:Zn2+/Cd2+-exporting ATPase
VLLAFPIITTAISDLAKVKFYKRGLVTLIILAFFVKADFRTAGIIAFFLLMTMIIENHTARL